MFIHPDFSENGCGMMCQIEEREEPQCPKGQYCQLGKGHPCFSRCMKGIQILQNLIIRYFYKINEYMDILYRYKLTDV